MTRAQFRICTFAIFATAIIFLVPSQYKATVISAALAILCFGALWPSAKSCAHDIPRLLRDLRRRTERSLRSMRVFYRPTRGVRFLSHLSFVILGTGFAVYALTLSLPLYNRFTLVGGVILVGAGVLECLCRIKRLVRKAWAQVAGKVAIGLLTSVVAFAAAAIARHVVFFLDPIDPKFAPGFSNLLTVAIAPIIWVYIVATLIAFWATIEMILLLLFSRVHRTTKMVAKFAGQALSWDKMADGMVCGSPQSSKPKSKLAMDVGLFLLRNSSLIFLVLFVFSATDVPKDESAYVPLLRSALVKLDYFHGPLCGMEKDGYYLPLEGKQVSVASAQDGDFVFEVRTCAQ